MNNLSAIRSIHFSYRKVTRFLVISTIYYIKCSYLKYYLFLFLAHSKMHQKRKTLEMKQYFIKLGIHTEKSAFWDYFVKVVLLCPKSLRNPDIM